MTIAQIKAVNLLHKHVQSNDTYYVDLGPAMESSETVTSATSQTTDTALTVGTPAVLGTNTTVTDYRGNSLTIEADTGVSITMSGGTVSTTPAIVTVVFTKDTGGVDAIDCEVIIGGETA